MATEGSTFAPDLGYRYPIEPYLFDREQPVMKSFLYRCASWGAIAGLHVGLWALLPVSPATAKDNSFEICSSELIDAGISAIEASEACSRALAPDDLSLCVTSMNQQAFVPAEEALLACFRDRRPLELATCVLEIDQATLPVNPTSVVDHCRRSLLPLRFSECAIGLTATGEIALAEALDSCIDAEDYPRDLIPES